MASHSKSLAWSVLSLFISLCQARAGVVVNMQEFRRAQQSPKCAKVHGSWAQAQGAAKPSNQLVYENEPKLPIRIYKLDQTDDFNSGYRSGVSRTSADLIKLLDTSDDGRWSVRAQDGGWESWSENGMSGAQSSRIEIFDENGKLNKTLRISDDPQVWQAKFLPRTHLLAVLLPERRAVRIYNVETGEILKELTSPRSKWDFKFSFLKKPFPSEPLEFSFSEDGRKMLIVWRIEGVREQVTVHDISLLLEKNGLGRQSVSAGSYLPGLYDLTIPPAPRESTALQKVNGRVQEVGTGKWAQVDLRGQENFSKFRLLNDGRVLAISSKLHLGVELAPQGGLIREFNLPDVAGFLPIEAISPDGQVLLTAEMKISRNSADSWLEAVERSAEINIISNQGQLMNKINYEPFVRDVLGISHYREISVRSLHVDKTKLQVVGASASYEAKFLLEIKTDDFISHWMTVWRFNGSSKPELVWYRETSQGDVPIMKGE